MEGGYDEGDADFWRFRWPRPDPCLSCPPWPLVEDYLLGHIARAALRRADPVPQQLARSGQIEVADLDPDGVLDEARRAVFESLGELAADWQRSLDYSQGLLKELAGFAKVPQKSAD